MSVGLKKVALFNVGLSIFTILIIAVKNLMFIWIPIMLILIAFASNVITTYTSIFYPTKLRDTAVGFFYSLNRLGGFLSQFIFLGLFEITTMLPYDITIIYYLFIIILISLLLLKYDPTFNMLDKTI